MFLSSLSIKKPYFAFMITLAIMIFGVMAYQKLPVANQPNIDIPYVWVNVEYPGASPITSEELLLKPIEEALKSVSGVKSINGSARSGGANVSLEFNLEVSGDKALEDVRNVMSTVVLPEDARKPYIGKWEANSEPILTFAVSAPKLSLQKVSALMQNKIQPTLQRVKGVSNIFFTGARSREIHIELNQTLLKAMNLSPLAVKRSVSSQILNQPAGQLRTPTQIINLETYQVPSELDHIAKLPLTLENNKYIRLESLSSIQDSMAEEQSYAEYNSQPALTVVVFKESQANLVQVAQDVKDQVERINAEYKNEIQLNVIEDNSNFIKESVHGVKIDLILGTLFAVLAVFLFLHEWKNTIICAIAIPTSIVGTFAVIHYLHFSLNFMTLCALTLCIGIVIDDSIVVVENIHRHRSLGKNALQAAFDGTHEIGFAALSVTSAILAVFIPVAFMEGVTGRFFYEFGMTVAVAVGISLFVAFTIVPMLSSRIGLQVVQKPRLFCLFDEAFAKFQNRYTRSITWVLKHKKITLSFALVTFVCSLVLLKFVPITFNPDVDEGNARIRFVLAANTPIAITKERGKEIEKYITKLPGVKNVLMQIGNNGGSNTEVNYTVFLIDKTKRNFTDKEFLALLTQGLNQFVKSSRERVGFAQNNYPLQFSLFSSKSELLKSYGNTLADYLNTLPNVSGATTALAEPVDELRIVPNNTNAAMLGVNPHDIADTLQLLFDGSKVGKYNDQGQYFDIRMLLPKNKDMSVSDLSSTFIPSQTQGSVLLSSAASLQYVPVDPMISHTNGERTLTVKANYTGQDLAGVMKQANEHIQKTKPFEITTQLSGEADNLNDTLKTVSKALLLAVVFVFMVLAVQFENVLAPLAILLSIPFSFSGAFLALLITRNPLSVYAMIGIIMLMGLVTKNAILLIEFAQQRIAAKHDIETALIEAAQVRLRPIMMTTITMIMGMLPMALSGGEGSEVRANIAITVIGGLLSSTVLTLLIVPCAYLVFARLKPTGGIKYHEICRSQYSRIHCYVQKRIRKLHRRKMG